MSLENDLRLVIAQLELCSHVSAVNLDPSSRDAGEEIGGKRPPGGIDRRDDREPDMPQKSAIHFRHRLARAKSPKTLKIILAEAEASLFAWRRIPDWKRGQAEPERGTLRWKRMIADSPDPVPTLAKRHEIGVRTVHHYRAQYGEHVDV